MQLTLKDLNKVGKFTAIFQHLKQLVDCIGIYFDDNGLYIQGMDNSQICLFECKLHSSWFDKYSFDDGDDKRVCMNTAILCKVICAVDDKSMIEISYSGTPDIINIKFGDPADCVLNKCFEISLMEIDSELMTIPDTEAQVDLSIDTTKFSKLVTQLLIFSDVLTLTFSDEDIKFRASGTEGAMSSTIDLDDVNEYAIGEGLELSRSYSLTYLNMMCSFAKLNKNIVMGFSEDMPMSLLYKLDGEESSEDNNNESDEEKEEEQEQDVVACKPKNNCYVSFYLAPKMDEDD